jgi:RNA ligase
MKLNELLDLNELENDVREGLINVQAHPRLPLRIFNYSHKTLSVDTWSRSMTMCRGLIVDNDDIVVARPFSKFWNYADPRHPETMPDNLPPSLPELSVKQDGSLLIGFKYQGQIGVATRGSFMSEQAQWANSWIKKNLPHLSWPEGWTPLWEVIASFNRIVVDYGDWEGVFALALVDNETGEEASRLVLEAWSSAQGFSATPLVDKRLEDFGLDEPPNFEGYVATWRRFGEPPHRVKLKTENYLILHRILTGLNPKAIWEMLAAGQNEAIDAILNDPTMPVPFKVWFTGWVDQLHVKFTDLERKAQHVYDRRPKFGTFAPDFTSDFVDVSPALRRKATALYFQKTPELCSILFAILDGKDYRSIIWDRLRPKATDTFKRDGE